MSKYPIGKRVDVTYNPTDVNDSFIEPPQPGQIAVMYGMGFCFLLIGTGSILAPMFKRKKTVFPACEPKNGASKRKAQRPTTIGGISRLIGRDVRELKISGWTDRQIAELIEIKLTEKQPQA